MRQATTNGISSCAECEHKEQSLFCKLSQQELDNLSDTKANNVYKKGQVIFFEGNQPHGLYCIFSGKVKIHKLGTEGKEQIVRFGQSGDVLGYRALLSNESYSATATAMEDCQICHISRSRFTEVLENNNDLSLKTILLLTQDLKKSEQRMINIAQKPVRERIAEALLMLKDSFGLAEDGATVNGTLTRREIGDIAGATTETTIRVLSEFNKDGVLRLEGKKIVVQDMPQLVRIANLDD